MEVSNRLPYASRRMKVTRRSKRGERFAMQQTLAAEMVILKDDVHLPDSVKVETEPYVPGWKVLKNTNAYGFDRAIRAAGWTFFSLSHALKISAIGGKQ